jgi:putative ABC transport system permease protein
MNLFRLVVRNIAGSSFRSFAVILCALLICAMTLTVGMILAGAEESLRVAGDRLGADILVVPENAARKIESALLMGQPTRDWMPASVLDSVAAALGVEAVSPQIYLATLSNASCCTVSDMFLVVYDPNSDFVVGPWLEKNVGGTLRKGEIIGGSSVFVPAGQQKIVIYGYPVDLRASMAATGTGLDHTALMTMETAREIASVSRTSAEKPLEIPEGMISAVMVKVRPGTNLRATANNISVHVRGVTPMVAPDLFQSQRNSLQGLENGVLGILLLVSLFSAGLLALVFSMAANERRRELGVLRALGATRGFIFQALLWEAALLGAYGGMAGAGLTVLAIVLFRKLIVSISGIPFLIPSLPSLATLAGFAILSALGIVMFAAMIPAYRFSRKDPSVAMRE